MLAKDFCISTIDDLTLQAQEENGETSFVRVEDPNATWLTMLRPAPSDSVRNASVFYKGKNPA